jgi:hypothetical protein
MLWIQRLVLVMARDGRVLVWYRRAPFSIAIGHTWARRVALPLPSMMRPLLRCLSDVCRGPGVWSRRLVQTSGVASDLLVVEKGRRRRAGGIRVVSGSLRPCCQAIMIQMVVVAGGRVLVVRMRLGGAPVLRTGGRHGGLRLTAYNFKGGVAQVPVSHSLGDNEQDPV